MNRWEILKKLKRLGYSFVSSSDYKTYTAKCNDRVITGNDPMSLYKNVLVFHLFN